MAFDTNAFNQATNFLNGLNNFNAQKHEILTVNSLQQAKDFVMNKGDSYLLLDPNADLLYLKEIDNIGKISLRIYRLNECTDEYINNQTPVTISKTEFDKLLKRLEKLESNRGGKNAVKESTEQQLFTKDE